MVMAGLDPAIHDFPPCRKTWMAGTSPAMTVVGLTPTSIPALPLTKSTDPACYRSKKLEEDYPMAARTKPPFRADVVGSLLRTAPLKEARAKRDKGAMTAAELKAVEDREVEKIIAKQAQVGLKLATDGEFRRSWWHFDFYDMLDGVEIEELDHGIQFQGVQTRPRTPRIKGKLGFSQHPMLEHFKFLKAHTRVTPKMCIPSPATLHFRLEPDAIRTKEYADRDAIFDDLAKTYKQAIRGFHDAGCRYLQFDDTAWAYLCSQAELKKARDRGLNADRLQQDYARVINQALEGKPADMTITTHVCRGNFRSTWISEGGYEPVAETMLGKLNYDGYFLEYDSARAGGFEPLRFLPKGNKIVVLGLVTTKSGTLEKKDDVKRRIDEATKFVSLDQLCLSPQCGFASTEEGNVLAEEEEWAKLRMVVELADEVWG
jgi:5-methyltetrahydropteroyltriglutamate--homocysteine methyltransferase